MAAVAALVRGPLRQVGSGPRRARRWPCALSELSPLSPPGFRAPEEAFSPLGARGAAGRRRAGTGKAGREQA